VSGAESETNNRLAASKSTQRGGSNTLGSGDVQSTPQVLTVPGPIHLIVNERAGRGRGAKAGAQAHEVLSARGARVEVRATRGAGDGAVLAREAREAGAAIVAAVGGDGTLHEVANGLLGPELLEKKPLAQPVPILGAVPVGSGNDYVKMLGVSRSDPGAAASLLLDGEPRLVDVGVLEGAGPREANEARPEVFLNNLGLCFPGEANARIESTRGLPGYLAYFVGAVIAFVQYKFYPVELEVDAYKAAGRHTIIHVNLGRYCGGGVIFTPEAELADGLFDVLVLEELTKLGAALVWKGVTTGHAREIPDATIVRGKEVVARADPGRLLHADGEVRKFVGREIRARVAPRALRVIGVKLNSSSSSSNSNVVGER
jgi:YegS/Rv2252/BmrU family lipid kinase